MKQILVQIFLIANVLKFWVVNDFFMVKINLQKGSKLVYLSHLDQWEFRASKEAI